MTQHTLTVVLDDQELDGLLDLAVLQSHLAADSMFAGTRATHKVYEAARNIRPKLPEVGTVWERDDEPESPRRRVPAVVKDGSDTFVTYRWSDDPTDIYVQTVQQFTKSYSEVTV